MKPITINNYQYTIPENYNELNKKQLLQLCKMLATGNPVEQLKTLYNLLGLKIWYWPDRKRVLEVKQLPAIWAHTLLTDNTLLGWIVSRSSLTNYTLPKLKHKGKVYHGPPNNILNISTAEFVIGYQFFKNYDQTKASKWIDNLIALLYRPKNPFSYVKRWAYGYNGDKRLPLNNPSFVERVKEVSSLPEEVKMAIFLQWSGAWAQMEKKPQYKYVFNSQRAQNGKDDPFLWEKIQMEMGERGTFGNYESVQRIDKDRFLIEIARNIEKYMMMKDNMKR